MDTMDIIIHRKGEALFVISRLFTGLDLRRKKLIRGRFIDKVFIYVNIFVRSTCLWLFEVFQPLSMFWNGLLLKFSNNPNLTYNLQRLVIHGDLHRSVNEWLL